MLINACYWALGEDDAIKADFNVDIVGKFEPTRFSFGGYKKGVKPVDHKL